MGVFDNVVHGLDIFGTGGSVGVGGGEAIDIDEGYRLSLGAWVNLCVLEAALFVERSDVFIESFSAGLRYSKRSMCQGGNSFVGWSLCDKVNRARRS